uniref:Uncharacterized protein n=1 Tax=Arundo donax TaxID=35708 RepID=A0A0A9GJX1_ARUDO
MFLYQISESQSCYPHQSHIETEMEIRSFVVHYLPRVKSDTYFGIPSLTNYINSLYNFLCCV